MGNDFGVVTVSKNARGFFLSSRQQHFFVFCRYTRLFDPVIYDRLYDEFVRFQSRAGIVSDLSEIAGLSSEWEQLAVTQKAFLPSVMPAVRRLKLASYYRPLVNVSGDYFSVLPVDTSKTLVMLGDVSGKGLSAALIMGLVMNTVKIMEDREDLVPMIYAIDKAIKEMHLQDKYTVVFIGIIDTKTMKIRYINASMSDPLIISRSPEGYRIKKLESNCGVIGIIDLPEVKVSEQRLFRGDMIMMATDGVSEVMDDSGTELGDTQLYIDTLKKAAAKPPKMFIQDVVDMILSYNGDKKLRDDVTMLVAKVDG
jgi:serine phosphatase RsbU (regulator of sigma subunit)